MNDDLLAVHGDDLIECESQWGILKADDGSKKKTKPIVGSYQFVYDSLYDTITRGAAPFVSAENAVAVIEIIEMAFESSRSGSVLYVDK